MAGRGRKGPVPDGGMIVKKQWYFQQPAIALEHLTDKQLNEDMVASGKAGFAVMYKDSAGSHDGWFWAEVGKFAEFDPTFWNSKSLWQDAKTWSDTTQVGPNGFGSACDRCHASAEVEHTFASLDNIAGFPGSPSRTTSMTRGRRCLRASHRPSKVSRASAGLRLRRSLATQCSPSCIRRPSNRSQGTSTPPGLRSTDKWAASSERMSSDFPTCNLITCRNALPRTDSIS